MTVESDFFRLEVVKRQPLTTERSLICLPLLLKPGQYLCDVQGRAWFPLYVEQGLQCYLMPSDTFEVPDCWRVAGQVLDLPKGSLLLTAQGAAVWPLLHALFSWPARRKDCRLLIEPPADWPLTLKPSRILWPAVPAQVIASIDLFDDWKLPARFVGEAPGCFDGSLAALQAWVLQHQPALQLYPLQFEAE